MSSIVYKCNCKKCANRKIIENKSQSIAFGVIDNSYCLNAQRVVFENAPKCETEIYCKNYKENKDE